MTPNRSRIRLRWIIAPFLVVVLALAALSTVGVDILSATRGFVGGESLWSKAQKDAVYHFAQYVDSHDEAEYRRFLEALKVPLGDRRARLEFERPKPDLEAVRQGLLEGGNHPDDIDGMVRLYRNFGHMSFLTEAIATWVEGDRAIDELRGLAARAHARIAGGDAGSPELHALLLRIAKINDELTVLEQRFSATLGAASRTAQRTVLIGMSILAAMLAFAGVLVTLRMLRGQAQAQAALHASNERFALAAAAAGIGVFDWDVRRERIAVDVRAGALYGLDFDGPSVISAGWSATLTHPDDLPALNAALKQSLAEGGPLTVRYRVCLPDGRVRHLELSASALGPGGANERRVVGIVRDVGDEVRAGQLRLDKESADRANLAKTDFLSRVSHELRTPLNAILGFAQVMEADARDPLPAAQALRLGHVLASGQQLLHLINDVLDFSSIEQGTITLAAQHIDLAGVLREAVERVEALALRYRVRLVLRLTEGGIPMRGDRQRLEQVFVSLLSNAIKYNRPGGLVEVTLRSDGAAHVVGVRDTGVGLTGEQMAQLFQPFNRLGAEYSQVSGSGLGLVIARQLVERMGGSLRVASEAGVGSTFSVHLRKLAPA